MFFFLDYDGTLAPIRKKPALARIGKKAKEILRKIANRQKFKVFIVSGRSLKDIKNMVGLKKINYIGNHGIEFDGPDFQHILPSAIKLKKYIQMCHRLLKKNAWPKGAFVENKDYTLSFHYRLVRWDKIDVVKKIFHNVIGPLSRTKKIKVTGGKKVLEVRPAIKWDKGKAVRLVLRKLGASGAQILYMGDDVTDEDAFRALRGKALSVLISKRPRKTFAQRRLESPAKAVEFLERYVS